MLATSEEECRIVLFDITERKQAEYALRANEEKYRAVCENSPVGILLTKPDGAILSANSAACRIFSMTEAELCRIGREGVVEMGDPRLQQALAERARTGTSTLSAMTLIRKDGTRFEAEVASTIFSDESGQNLTSMVLNDITERKRAEVRITNYAKRLLDIEDELRKSIARELHDDIAQELTALGLNLAYVSRHMDGVPENKIRPIIDDSRALTTEVSRSVRALMVELHPPQLEDSGLAAAIRMHAEQFSNRFGIEVTVNADPQCPRLTMKKETAIFRIVQEALSNIVKHAAATRVTIFLSKVGESVRLIITDDGKGFAPQEASPQPNGSGWGLTNMRERARLNGGVLSVRSSLGQGTTISLEIKEAQ